MKRVLLAVLVVVGVAFAGDEPDVRAIERDLASVTTEARLDAVHRISALHAVRAQVRLLRFATHDADAHVRKEAIELLGERPLRHETGAIEAFLDLMLDPDPLVARLARERLFDLEPGDAAHLPTARLEAALRTLTASEDRYHIVQLVEAVIDAGGRFYPGPLLEVAAETSNFVVVRRALLTAWHASQTAPVITDDLVNVAKLLANQATHEDGVEIIGNIGGTVLARPLVEVEATCSDVEARFAAAALDKIPRAELRPILEGIAATTTDARVRDVARRRLVHR